MANYSTVADVDTFALARVDVAWLTCDDKGVTAAVNNGAGYTAAATSIVFDGLSESSGIEQYDILKIGNEYLRVDAVTYATATTGTLTVTRGVYGSTAATIADNASISVRNQRKATCIELATDDIVSLHGQYLYDGTLWLDGETGLIEAENRQTLWVNKYLDERQSSERIAQLTSGSYSDGAVTINPVTKPRIDPQASMIVRTVMRLNEVQSNAFKRG